MREGRVRWLNAQPIKTLRALLEGRSGYWRNRGQTRTVEYVGLHDHPGYTFSTSEVFAEIVSRK